MNEITTPGPANRLAIRPATTYIPVPLHDPTPRDTRSLVVSSFFSDSSSPRSPDPAFDISFFLSQIYNFPFYLRLTWYTVVSKSQTFLANSYFPTLYFSLSSFLNFGVLGHQNILHKMPHVLLSYIEIEVISLYENRCSFFLFRPRQTRRRGRESSDC